MIIFGNLYAIFADVDLSIASSDFGNICMLIYLLSHLPFHLSTTLASSPITFLPHRSLLSANHPLVSNPLQSIPHEDTTRPQRSHIFTQLSEQTDVRKTQKQQTPD